MIEFPCQCRFLFRLGDDMAGAVVQCPQCGKLNDIPSLDDLPNINRADGTFRVDETPDEEERQRLSTLQRTYSRVRTDEAGNEIDLRNTADDVDEAGAEEIPLDLKDEVRPGAPKYDPVTGELIRPIDLRTDDRAIAAENIPLAKTATTVAYATGENAKYNSAGSIAMELFQPANVTVMIFIFLMFMVGQLATYVFAIIAVAITTVTGVDIPTYVLLLPLLLMLIPHYGNTVEETGPDGRDELPRPFRSLSWSDDIWNPFVRIMMSAIVCYWPTLLIGPLEVNTGADLTWVRLALLVAGTFFFPAVLLTMVGSGALVNLRPDRVLGTIGACGAGYVLSFVLFLSALALHAWTIFGTAMLPPGVANMKWVEAANSQFVLIPLIMVAVYLMHYACWYLGILYRLHQPQFPWEFQHHVRRNRTSDPRDARRRKRNYTGGSDIPV